MIRNLLEGGFSVRVLERLTAAEHALVVAAPDAERCAWVFGLRICKERGCSRISPWGEHAHIGPEHLAKEQQGALRLEAQELLTHAVAAANGNGAVLYFRPARILRTA